MLLHFRLAAPDTAHGDSQPRGRRLGEDGRLGRPFRHECLAQSLHVEDRSIGAIVIYALLQQKDGFSALDYELFTLLAGHAATAIFASQLYSQSERKLNTIQGFIDLLTS